MSIQIDEQFLSSQFDALNELHFGGKVPRPIKFTVISSKRFFGKCVWYEYQEHKWYELSISDYYERTRRGYINTLIHEMIHAYLWDIGKDYLGHGEDFLTIAAHLNGHGYDINPVDECESLLTSEPKQKNLIFGTTKSGYTFVMAYAKNRETYYRNYFDRNAQKYANLHWVKTMTKRYGCLPICRTRLKGKKINSI